MDKIGKLFLLLVLFSCDLSAQEVKEVDGYPVIDLTALNPLGAVLSSADALLRLTVMNEKEPSNSALLDGNGLDLSGENGVWNDKMSIKFQVMCADHTVGLTDWATAYNQCKSYNVEGGSAGQWRLPTQRELEMIWILYPQLIGKAGFTAFNANFYWSATEYNANNAWCVNFAYGGVDNENKTSTYKVRCVRDLE